MVSNIYYKIDWILTSILGIDKSKLRISILPFSTVKTKGSLWKINNILFKYIMAEFH